jgi:hypothetical protein
MDTKNDPRGGREERARESAILEVDASMSDKCHSVPDLGHERQVTPSSAIERPRGDAAGQGERVVSGALGGRTLDILKGKRTTWRIARENPFHFD